jgi:hypothetical protein
MTQVQVLPKQFIPSSKVPDMDPACHLAHRLRTNHGLLDIHKKLTRLYPVVRNAIRCH